jgi:hypothetical protein
MKQCRIGDERGGRRSLVAHVALGLDLDLSVSHGSGELRLDRLGNAVRIAVAAFGLAGESLGEDHSQRIKPPQVHPSQRQAGGVAGIVGDDQPINTLPLNPLEPAMRRS